VPLGTRARPLPKFPEEPRARGPLGTRARPLPKFPEEPRARGAASQVRMSALFPAARVFFQSGKTRFAFARLLLNDDSELVLFPVKILPANLSQKRCTATWGVVPYIGTDVKSGISRWERTCARPKCISSAGRLYSRPCLCERKICARSRAKNCRSGIRE